MSEDLVPFDADLLGAMDACVEHARDLIESARLVQQAGRPNIAFHLAVLALEELGRRELLGIKAIGQPDSWADKFLQDHIQKLFWCFFGTQFAGARITADSLERLKGLASRIHGQRLAGLYVDVDANGISIPADRIPADEAERLLAAAESRLKASEADQLKKGRTREEIEFQSWFVKTAQHAEHRKFVFSGTSLDKLAELASAKGWMLWLKQEIEKSEAEAKALAQMEIDRGRQIIDGDAGVSVTKWKIRIRLYTNSHSIRQKSLNHWNDKSPWIKLIWIDKKDQLILELQLGDDVPIQGLWYIAWGIARSFVTALNIATMGFWFWRIPTQVDKYYESIEDVIGNAKLVLERKPSLKVDWGENRALTAVELDHLATVFSCMPRPGEKEKHEPYNFYIGGLVFLSLNDVHWQCESTILGNFLSSTRAMMRYLKALPEGMLFSDALDAFLTEQFPEIDDDKLRVLTLCRAFEQDRLSQETVNLKDATFGKLFCDAYFLNRIRPYEFERKRQGKDGGAPA